MTKKSSSKISRYKIGSVGLPDMSLMAFMNGLVKCADEIEESAKRAKAQLQVQITREAIEDPMPQNVHHKSLPKPKI